MRFCASYHPHHNLFELRCNSGHKLCKEAIFLEEKSAPVVAVHAADHDFTGYVRFFDSPTALHAQSSLSGGRVYSAVTSAQVVVSPVKMLST